MCTVKCRAKESDVECHEIERESRLDDETLDKLIEEGLKYRRNIEKRMASMMGKRKK
jgi:hypothetical protein